MGIELELAVLLALQTFGMSIFARFEVETPALRGIAKWGIVILGTVGLSTWIGHWSLAFPLGMAALGLTVHFVYCRKHGFDPIKATPRRRYYEFRGWEWQE